MLTSSHLGIKQEPSILDGLDFSMPPPPQIATKRPFEETNGGDDPSKRVKTETEVPQENGFNHDPSAELEDGLALLVQNALSNVGDLVSQFSQEPDIPHTTTDPMDLDTVPVPEAPLPPPPVSFVTDPQKFCRNASWHALGNLAISMLLTLSQPPFDDIVKPLRDSSSEHGQCFRRYQAAFEGLKMVYSTGPILSADELEVQDNESRTILELSNLSQFGAWLVAGDRISYSQAHNNFHSIFRGQISDLSPEITELYLELKTQLAIESLIAKPAEQQINDYLNEVLLNGLEEKLRGLHGGFELTEADQNLVSSVQLRKEVLEGEVQHQAETAVIREKYPANELLHNYSKYVKGRLTSASELGTKLGLSMPSSEDLDVDILSGAPDDDMDFDDLSSFFEKTTSGLVQNALAGLTEEEATSTPAVEPVEQPAEEAKSPPKAEDSAPQTNGKVDLMTDYKELEALVAESTSNYVKTTLHGLSPVPYQPTVPTSTSEHFSKQTPLTSIAESMAAQTYLNHLQQAQSQHPYYSYAQQIPEPQPPPPGPGENLPPNQTCASAILYDKARQAALSKSSAHTRREGLHSTRRPWTQEEEKALMAGLDMVKGPHWSQILTLFGHHGTISDILKDRTQVQLKDKARNLKLFFLKTNSEMPYYLQAVTGELKTRAPTQAARKEAEERARMNSEEEQARLQGIMTLAGGLQNPPAKANGNPAAAVGSGVVTPAQAASAAQAATTQHGSSQYPASSQPGPAAHSGYPASSLPQARPTVQAMTQQALQSVAQPPPRPQTQLHLPQPAAPRPQPQQHQQPQHQPQQHQPTTQSPMHPQSGVQSRSQTSTPVGQPHHSPSAHHTPTPQQAPTQPIQSQYALPQPRQQPFPSPPVTQAPMATMVSQAPAPQPQTSLPNDNDAEAALLQGLQAAMAESL
ncbi:Fc.00g002980.m01.CDS01 [Cosmosporella sp. VM-42]